MVVRTERGRSQLCNPGGARTEKARTRAGAHTTVGPVSRPAGPARWEQPEDTTWSPASCYLHAGPATVGPDRVRAGAGPLPEVVRVDSGLRHDTARAGITAQPNGQLAVTGDHHMPPTQEARAGAPSEYSSPICPCGHSHWRVWWSGLHASRRLQNESLLQVVL